MEGDRKIFDVQVLVVSVLRFLGLGVGADGVADEFVVCFILEQLSDVNIYKFLFLVH